MAKKSTPKAGDPVPKRVKIPIPIQHQVLMEAGCKCARPVCHNVIALQLHHLHYVSDGGSNDPANLLPLCGYCHDMHHRGEIPTEAIGIVAFPGLDLVYEVDGLCGTTVMAMVTQLIGP